MSDLKNLIVVDITDREYIKLGEQSELLEITGDGTILTRNTSQSSRLWNCTNDLKEIVNTNIPGKVLNVGALNPGQDHKQDYHLQNLQEPCLKVLEVFDTDRTTGQTVNNAFLYIYSNKCKITLTFTNTLSTPISDIKSTRQMPAMLKEVEISPPSAGKADLSEEEGKRVLKWDIGTLDGNQSAELQLICTVNMEERTRQSLGALNVTYVAHNHQLTMVKPEVRSITDSMSGVSREEGSNPGTWDCNVEFINDSEFNVRLEDVKVDHKIPTGKETVVSQEPNEQIGPQGSWDYDFNLITPNVPELESAITFTALFGVITRTIGVINKESTIYDVLAAEIHKAIIPPEVGAYANTDMKIENSIPNTGTACLNTVFIEDEIPKDFVPPKVEQITLTIMNPGGSIEIQNREEFIDKIFIQPDDISPEAPHKITLSLKDLKDQLPPQSSLLVSYPLLAKNPKPEVRYNTPVQIMVNTPRKGAELLVKPPEEPVVQIKYIQRKLKTLKSIKPGINEGEFNITVRVQNKGDVELENLLIKDKIPAGFSLTEFHPPAGTTHVREAVEAESELQLTMELLKGNETLIINYKCTGSGDYPRSEPIVNVLGRGGAAVSSGPTSAGAKEAAPETDLGMKKSSEVQEIFTGIFKKLDAAPTVSDFAVVLERFRDDIPPGPVRHQYSAFIRELQNMEDQKKIIVGALQDQYRTKLKDFQNSFH
ncbi:MAG: hypothetical protein JW891_09910 [Candidatus Lokiarchaeota archaeon]|nr:hypothetical protein [Candidatus Lokiarchaeota archaeon]